MAKPEIKLSDELIELMRAAEAEREKALSAPYSVEGWAPWQAAAETFQAAVTAHAEVTGQNRSDVEAAVKKVVLHPEGA